MEPFEPTATAMILLLLVGRLSGICFSPVAELDLFVSLFKA